MKTRLLMVLAIGMIGLPISVYAFEPTPVGVNVVEYGIFDPNDNNTIQLKVGEKYHIKAYFESELTEPISFTYFVQVIDKNKHFDEVVDEFSTSGKLEPGESKSASFTWTPKYGGEFRTFAGITDDVKNVMVGNIPQFDMEVVLDKGKWHDYFPTLKILNLKEQYLPNEPITPSILRKDLNACNAYQAEIIKDKIRVWEYVSVSSCVVMDPQSEIESEVQIPRTGESILLSDVGEYTLRVDIADYKLQEKFWISEKIDFKNTANPNECWYQDDDGTMVPCKMGSDEFDMAAITFAVVFWPYIVLGITFVIIFIVWKKRK